MAGWGAASTSQDGLYALYNNILPPWVSGTTACTHTLTHKVKFGPTSSLGAWHNIATHLQMFKGGGYLLFLSLLTFPTLVSSSLQRKGVRLVHL